MTFWPRGAARIAEVGVGITYLIAAVLKAMDFNAFLPQIHAYQIVESNGTLLVVAFAALALETFLGVCMILGVPWRRAVHGAGAAMLCFFTLVIIYAWQVHGLEDCGCFGKVKVTPPQAIGKNLVLLAFTALAFYGLVWRVDPSQSPIRRPLLRLGMATVLALIACLAVVPQLGISAPTPPPTVTKSPTDTPTEPPVASGPFANYVVESEYGDRFELGRGEHLVALLSMTCDHCMESVPQLNEFMFDPTLPPLVAICLEPEVGSMEEFKLLTQPQFPMMSLGDKSLNFFPLLETASSPPRLVFVRDGSTVVAWDGEMPDYPTLTTALAEHDFVKKEQ